MSLDFNVSKVKNHKVVTSKNEIINTEGKTRLKWHPVTDALTWATMTIGINEITEKNWKDFYRRLNLYESLNGTFLTSFKGQRFITPLEVYTNIGLSTNASKKTEKQFLDDALKNHKTDIEQTIGKTKEQYRRYGIEHMTMEAWDSLWEGKGKNLDERLQDKLGLE